MKWWHRKHGEVEGTPEEVVQHAKEMGVNLKIESLKAVAKGQQKNHLGWRKGPKPKKAPAPLQRAIEFYSQMPEGDWVHYPISRRQIEGITEEERLVSGYILRQNRNWDPSLLDHIAVSFIETSWPPGVKGIGQRRRKRIQLVVHPHHLNDDQIFTLMREQGHLEICKIIRRVTKNDLNRVITIQVKKVIRVRTESLT